MAEVGPGGEKGAASPTNGALWALEATTDFVILMDREFRITFINPATARLNGVTQEEVVGRTIWEQWPGNVGTDIERNYRRAMATGEAVRFFHGYFEAGRFDLWLEIHAYPSPDGLAVFFRDVSDERRRDVQERDDRERLASAMRAVDLGVWRCELPLDERPFYWSPQIRRHFGISDEEPVGAEEFMALLHPDDRQSTADAMARAIDGRAPYDVIYRTLGCDGKTRWVRATGNAFYRDDGTPYRFDGFTVELTERIEREEEAREAKARTDALLASTDVATWTLDLATGRIGGDANLATMFGITADELRESNAESYTSRMPAEDAALVGETLARSVETGEPYEVEFRIFDGDRTRQIVSRGVPERDAEGAVVRIPGVNVDITALKAAQARERSDAERIARSERRQRLRVELVDALRGLTDAGEIGARASELVGRFFGASRAYTVDVDAPSERFEVRRGWHEDGPRLEGVFGYDDFGHDLIAAIGRGARIAVEDAATHPLTRNAYAAAFAPAGLRSFLVVPRVRDGTLVGMFALNDRVPRAWTDEEGALMEDLADRVWDAIERARAVAELERLNAALDERVRERTAELLRANEEAEAFNYSIAHDLRTPLRAISSASSILMEETGDRLEPEELALLARQSAAARRLGTLIDALLDLSRLSRRPVVRAEFDLSALAREVGEAVFAGGSAPVPALAVADGLRADGDPALVRLLLQNLLENARKFSPGGGTVQVGGSGGTFWVADEGVGFEMRFAPKIFLPFERLVGDGEFPGTGIGLANVDRIVKRHGGRVWAESAPGKGATFSFTLA